MRQAKSDVASSLGPCEGCDHRTNRTLFVHLCSGEVEEVSGVMAHGVSKDHVLIETDNGETMVIPRRDVYFISCDHISPPSMQ